MLPIYVTRQLVYLINNTVEKVIIQLFIDNHDLSSSDFTPSRLPVCMNHKFPHIKTSSYIYTEWSYEKYPANFSLFLEN